MAILPLSAQEKKPSKPDVSAEDRAKVNAKLNELKNKEEIKKAWDILEKAAQRNKGAEKEVERLKKDGTDITSDEAKKKFEPMLSDEDKAELKRIIEAAKPEAQAALEQQREKMRLQQGKTAPQPLPEDPVRPDAFDSVPPPAPLPPMRAVNFPAAPLSADRLIKGPERDPKNPDIELPDSDVRRRTWIAEGDVRLRLTDLAVDADEVTILMKPGRAAPAKPKAKVADPLKRQKEPPFDRLIAKGRVRVMFVDSLGRVQVGRGNYMIYDQKTGEFIVKDWPEVQIEDSLLRARSKDAVARMSRLREAEFEGAELVTLSGALKLEDFPTDRATPIPAAAPENGSNKVP